MMLKVYRAFHGFSPVFQCVSLSLCSLFGNIFSLHLKLKFWKGYILFICSSSQKSNQIFPMHQKGYSTFSVLTNLLMCSIFQKQKYFYSLNSTCIVLQSKLKIRVLWYMLLTRLSFAGYNSLRRLRKLEILDLSSNSFNNSIFPFLNAATSLTTLVIQNNFMNGSFPFKGACFLSVRVADLAQPTYSFCIFGQFV